MRRFRDVAESLFDYVDNIPGILLRMLPIRVFRPFKDIHRCWFGEVHFGVQLHSGVEVLQSVVI